jgi:hypothetical protein
MVSNQLTIQDGKEKRLSTYRWFTRWPRKRFSESCASARALLMNAEHHHNVEGNC